MIMEKQKNLERYIEAVKNAFPLCTMEHEDFLQIFFSFYVVTFTMGGWWVGS